MDKRNRSYWVLTAALTLASALYGMNYIWARYVDPLAGSNPLVGANPLAAPDPSAGMITFVAQASFFAWLTLFLFLRGGPGTRPSAAHWTAMVFNGVSGPVILSLILAGSRLVTPALASIIVVSNVLFIALFARATGRKRFTSAQVAALAVGFTGVGLIGASRGGFHGEALGVGLLTLAAMLIAAATITIESPIKELGWAPVTRWVAAVSALAGYCGLAFFWEVRILSAPQTVLSAFMGVFSLGLAGILFSIGLSRLGSADTSVFKLLIPFFSLIYGAALFGEIPDMVSFMAGLMVAGALVVYHRSGGADLRSAMGEGAVVFASPTVEERQTG